MALEPPEAAATQPAAGRRSPLGALATRDFRLLWLNSFLFFLAGGMRVVAIGWLMLDLTDSPRLVGVALFAQGIPLALFSLPAGVWADRLDRRFLLILSHAGSMLLTAVLAALILAGVVTPWAVFVVAFLIGTAMALGVALLPVPASPRTPSIIILDRNGELEFFDAP